MKRRVRSSLYLVLVLAILIVPLSACTPGANKSAKGGEGSTYKIGFLAAITGGAAFLGEPERDAAVMVQEKLNADGGIVGPDGVKHPIEIVIQDTQTSGDVAITVAKKLINDDEVVALIGTTSSAVSMALLPVAQEAGVSMISMASSGGIVEPASERKWIFKTAQSNKHTAPWQVKYAKAKGLTKVANFYVNNAYGEDGASAIRQAAQDEGVEIVFETSFGAGDSDMTGQLTQLRASEAQALLVTAIPPAAAILTKQFREMGIDMPIIHNHGIGMKPFISLCGEEVAEGVLFPMGKMVAIDSLDSADPQKKVLSDFVADYEESSGSAASTFAGHAWDAVMITVGALSRLEDGLSLEEQRTKLRDEIESTNGFVGTGGIFNMTPDEHVGLSPDDVVMARITNGTWEHYPPNEW